MDKRSILFADHNMYWLSQNSYPGRGIVMGMDQTGEYMIQVYWIMGRSENSRNRVLSFEGGRLFTEVADPTKVKDPSLIIYNAMQESNGCFVVSNGNQTDTVLPLVIRGKKLISSLADYEYEPDDPNFTSRITGVCGTETDYPFGLAMLRKSLWDASCDRICYYYEEIKNGFGFCITTYNGNGNPLPSFKGEPLLMSMVGDIDTVAYTYWQALDEKNRIALAIKFISQSGLSQIRVINKFTKV